MTREDRGASSFDELAVGLSSGTLSRGKALRLMGAALVGGTLASLGIGEAGADDLCKPEGKKCRKDAQCCSGSCVDRKCGEAGACSGSQQACDIPFPCGANNECLCFNTTEGSHACVVDFPGCELPTCQSSNDCPAGTACVRTCCEFNLCAPLCGTTTSAALQAESGVGNPARKPTL
jgi:hypothetical protein